MNHKPKNKIYVNKMKNEIIKALSAHVLNTFVFIKVYVH